jgi:hypothetical protein
VGQRLGILITVLVLSGIGLTVGSSVFGGDAEGNGESRSKGDWDLGKRVRVEVFNGGGVQGVAWNATQALRDRGFDVVFFGNAGTYSSDSSVVMDRVGDPEAAGLVAGALGISRVGTEVDTTLFVDVTVRLGPDWTGPPIPEAVDQESAAWWDIRRFFRKADEPGSETSNRP